MMRSVVVVLVLCTLVHFVLAEQMDCYGPGSIAGAVIGTLLATLALLATVYLLYNCYIKARREKQLVLETDPERGGDKYAFDNPCFKDASGGLTPIGKALDKSGTKLLDTGKKWSQWSPLGAFVSTKNEKKRTLDDSHLDAGEVKFVSLRGHDFTGLGFTICGNMRDGIYIKDVLHRGPAHDSGRLNPGDRIHSVRISFENMVYEDAVAILSSASPYHMEVEAKGSGRNAPGSGGQGQEMRHPVYRSRSSGDLLTIGKSARKGLFQSDHETSPVTDYSTLQVSSNNTTMERERKSPQTEVNSLTKPERSKKSQPAKNLSPDQLKSQLEQNLAQKISHPRDIHSKPKVETEIQTSEVDSKKGFQKFGVRVLPMESKTENTQRSPKSSELSQNDNNINQERQLEHSVLEGRDEVDKSKMNGEAPPVKRREKKNGDLPREIPVETPKETENFVRQNSVNGSGIKRDKAGIPQEIPEHMLQAAVAARKNRKSTEVIDKPAEEETESVKTPKKQKGKAPAPPPGQTKTETKIDEKTGNKLNFTDNLDEISTLEEKEPKKEKPALVNQTDDNIADMKPETLTEKLDDSKEYCSDSDIETDNQSSVNTIELNSSDITIHHAEQESNDIKGRKTASTGDLSKIQKGKKSNTGTLERAQSLDITDSGIPTLTKKRKATKDGLDSKLSSDESLYEASNLKVKEPRLSLALDGLDTFQRNRLKKSSEWGNLEDVIMNLDKVEAEEISSSTDEKISFNDKSPTKFDFGMKDTTFGNPNLNDVNLDLVEDEIKEETEKVKNILWPTEETQEKMEKEIPVPKPQIVDKKDKVSTEEFSTIKVQNVLWPLSDTGKSKENVEQTSHSINIQTTPQNDTNITDSSKRDDNSPKSTSKTDITEAPTPPEKVTQKPPLPEQSFSLKAQFQEKLNSKLNNDTPPVSTKPQSENSVFHPGKSSQNFIFAEKYASNNDDHYLPSKLYDTNVSDDIKVSRHSLGSLERPKSDVLKSVNKLKMQSLISSDQGGVSNVTITESKNNYENGITVTENQENKVDSSVFDMSTASELYTTAIDSTIKDETAETPNNGIKNITITETITDNKYFTDNPSSLTIDTSSDGPDSIKSNTLTFVTEIQVSTPPNNKNVSEIEINTDSTQNSPQQSTSEPKSPEENLKKLPEMKFTTSSYETPKTPEKRLSHIELLRSNFEKSPPKPAKPADLSPSKSRIPVATKIDFKTSPERREIIDTEEKEIVEIMSSAVHSTPVVTNQRFGNPVKTTAKNVTVTSIRTSSKIPSGSHSFKPPVPVKPDHTELHESRNGGTESTFKHWVFNPSESSVTNIVVNNNKESHK